MIASRMFLVFAGAFLLSVAVGCQSLTDGAKDDFSRTLSCPKESLEARQRKDVRPYDLQHPTPPEPATEIAADPSRRAVWEREQREVRDRVNDRETVIEVRGCSHQKIYLCSRANTGSNSGNVMCTDYDYPPTLAKW
jgi:hypothetical protein